MPDSGSGLPLDPAGAGNNFGLAIAECLSIWAAIYQ